MAHFLDAIARSKRATASERRTSDRPRTASAISRARKLLATPEPSITVPLHELRRFFNYDLDLEKAFKVLQKKVEAGERIAEVPQLPADYERVREFKRDLRARIVALMDHLAEGDTDARREPSRTRS
ncbi:hypothetical protein AMYX_40000 [Anaeromyxobacter diazotrophicus]|uniref:Uncharacterized protein n=2 Tax=Anaeromyxobacter diazotrophicus TaxID=2590199 RepID=A0A7I9VT37_9BACT|nr:hypothetical protein AMYX_40000 [Anaeromyxobacter diazotrophicus]